MGITVESGDGFTTLVSRFRREADEGLGRELGNRISDVTSSLAQVARDNALRTLPGRNKPNGLGVWVIARTQFSATSDGASTGTVTVTVTAKSTSNIARINDGTVRHPLFGNRRHWYTQSVTPGWWSNTVREISPKVRPAIEEGMALVARRIEGA